MSSRRSARNPVEAKKQARRGRSAPTMGKPRRVAIVGAGPSGLVTAKSLLDHHPPQFFAPTIYEKKSHVGGMWPVKRDDATSALPPEMSTNISKHLVSFSDLAWDSLSLNDAEFVPTFPAAHQVGKYLQAYRERYLPPETVQLDTEVIRVTATQGPRPKFTVTTQAGRDSNRRAEEVFDHVVVASGFFATPRVPEIAGRETFHGPVVHSADLPDINRLLARMHNGANIAVIGGSMSAGEVAAKLALHLSDLQHGSREPARAIGTAKIYHIAPRPFWMVPPLVPADAPTNGVANPRPTFQPLDWILADLDRRPSGQRSFVSSASLSPETARKQNAFFHSLLGPAQCRGGWGALEIPCPRGEDAPWVSISSSFAEFVRSGAIDLAIGRVSKMCGSTITVQTANGDQTTEMDDVGAIVLATGFTPHEALSFLSPAIRRTIAHNPADHYQPIPLCNFGTMHAAMPSLGFVGFYRGPYFGVLEQQARFLGAWWSDGLAHTEYEAPGVAGNMERRGQFPMGDYRGLMESISAILPAARWAVSRPPSPRRGIALPARYPSRFSPSQPDGGHEEAKACRAVRDTVQRASFFVGPAIFGAWAGQWQLTRQMHNADVTGPSGSFGGVAHLHARHPTDDDSAAELVYSEEGVLVTARGQHFRASRRYLYRLSKAEPQTISAWFVKADEDRAVADSLFHTVHLVDDGHDIAGGSGGWRAVGSHHLCEADHYDTNYWFGFDGVAIAEWELRYHVRGPRKDYWMSSGYRR